jgi:hypothetical protein
MVVLAMLPFAIGAAAAGSKHGGHARLSQLVANLGIALGLAALLVQGCAVAWMWRHGRSVLSEVNVLWLVLPTWMLLASWWIEHALHPGAQESIRRRVRTGVLWVIVLAVVYWLLSTMRVWMLVHTGVLGLLLFIAALIGLFYMLVRRAV